MPSLRCPQPSRARRQRATQRTRPGVPSLRASRARHAAPPRAGLDRRPLQELDAPPPSRCPPGRSAARVSLRQVPCIADPARGLTRSAARRSRVSSDPPPFSFEERGSRSGVVVGCAIAAALAAFGVGHTDALLSGLKARARRCSAAACGLGSASRARPTPSVPAPTTSRLPFPPDFSFRPLPPRTSRSAALPRRWARRRCTLSTSSRRGCRWRPSASPPPSPPRQPR